MRSQEIVKALGRYRWGAGVPLLEPSNVLRWGLPTDDPVNGTSADTLAFRRLLLRD
ncbi:MAG: hypothetical protein H6875_04945 [Hyphomicrobiaceae bacterium]|nr:hypothetical protein [Hyphomicrobiaceae bacterium]